MSQAHFEYEPASRSARSCTIVASRSWLRAEMAEDARAAGLRIAHEGALGEGENGELATGDVVLVDCPTDDEAAIAALGRLATRAADNGGGLLVSTTLDALETVYASLPHGDIPLLVDPTRGERVIALGGLLSSLGRMGVRDLSEGDRLEMFRLAEQVNRIAERLDGLESGDRSSTSAFRFNSPDQEFNHGQPGDGPAAARKRATLPDPRLIRSIIRQRQARAKFFGEEMFADPAWDMLLDLTAAHAEHKRVSVTSLCIASGVPPTTALRWITQMVEAGLLERVQDSADKRRAFIRLSDRAVDGMARYFAEIASEQVGGVI